MEISGYVKFDYHKKKKSDLKKLNWFLNGCFEESSGPYFFMRSVTENAVNCIVIVAKAANVRD